jgi:pilus assembly protein TadC
VRAMAAVPVPWILGPAWGLVAAAPFARAVRRGRVSGRLAVLPGPPREASARRVARFRRGQLGAIGRVVRGLAARHRARAEAAAIGRELPVVLDLLGVAVGAGCTPFLAVEVASRWAPPTLADRLAAVPRACRLGAALADALDDLGRTTPALGPLADALAATDRLGAPVGPALARLAATARADTRRRAEARARTVPVRLLFPLVFLVLPAFGLLTVVPALMAGLARA